MAPLSSVTPSVHTCPGEPGSGSAAATLQSHLENWPGLGMATSPANKAVYINPARHGGSADSPGAHPWPAFFTGLHAFPRAGNQALTHSLFHLANSSQSTVLCLEWDSVPQHQLAFRSVYWGPSEPLEGIAQILQLQTGSPAPPLACQVSPGPKPGGLPRTGSSGT